MSKGWSLSRSTGKKVKGEMERSSEEEKHIRRLGPKIEQLRSRPSSMVSIAFPSSASTSQEFDQTSNSPRKTTQSFSSISREDSTSSGAINLLSVTQQKDLARRERKGSNASNTSSLLDANSTGGDSSSNNSKQNQPGTPKRRQISTNSTTLPSLIKSPAARSSAMSSTSNEYTQFSVSSKPVNSPSSTDNSKSRKDQKKSDRAEDKKTKDDMQVSYDTIATGSSRTLGDITNQTRRDKSKEIDDLKKQEVGEDDLNHSNAIDSLMALKGDKKGKRSGAKGSIDKSLGSTQHASLVITSPKLRQGGGESDDEHISRPDEQHHFPYLIRRNKVRSKKFYPPHRYLSSLDDSLQRKRLEKQQKQIRCDRYDFTYSSNLSNRIRFKKQDQMIAQARREYKLIGLGVPTTFGSDRLTSWVVERAARFASCVINLFGS